MENFRIAKEEGVSKNLIYYFVDHLGTTRLTCDSVGKSQKYDYAPFGEDFNYSNERFTYTGKEDEGELIGLYYFNARYYDSKVGRFISEDLVKDGVNWYSYCNNNPLRFVDPNGESIKDNPLFSDVKITNDIYIYGSRNFKMVQNGDGKVITPEWDKFVDGKVFSNWLLTGACTVVGMGCEAGSLLPGPQKILLSVAAKALGVGGLAVGKSMDDFNSFTEKIEKASKFTLKKVVNSIGFDTKYYFYVKVGYEVYLFEVSQNTFEVVLNCSEGENYEKHTVEVQ